MIMLYTGVIYYVKKNPLLCVNHLHFILVLIIACCAIQFAFVRMKQNIASLYCNRYFEALKQTRGGLVVS